MGPAQVGCLKNGCDWTPALGFSRMHASCSAGALDLRDAASIPSIAGFELHAVEVGTAPLTLIAGSLPVNPCMLASSMVQVSSIPTHPSSNAAARISGESPMDPAGIAEPNSGLSNPAAILMSTIPRESEGCAALDGPAAATQGAARLPQPPTAVRGIASN